MVKAFCKQCGSWENVHPDGLCHVHHYRHAEGRPFPTAATPEAVAREQGGTGRAIVDVEFAAATGEYASTIKRQASEAEDVARNEPILGKLSAAGKTNEDVAVGRNRISPAGPDANDKRSEPDRALPAEVKAAVANVAGLQRDAEEMGETRTAGDVNAKQAGNADLKTSVAAAKK